MPRRAISAPDPKRTHTEGSSAGTTSTATAVKNLGEIMLNVLMVLLALAASMPRALADEFSVRSFPGTPQSIDQVKEAKLWLSVEDEDPNCAINTQTMIDPFYNTAVASQHPRLSFAEGGRPTGPAVVIAIRTTRI